MTRDTTRPAWAQRLRAEREARRWTQQDMVDALRAHSTVALTDDLLRTLKGWEAGDHRPSDFYRPLIARVFGTVTAAIFGPDDEKTPMPAPATSDLLVPGMGTLEIVQRLRRSDLDSATLDAIRVTVDRLCCEYPFMPSAELRHEGQQWLDHLTRLLDTRLTLHQHREVLVLAGWLALLVGCVEYDMTDLRSAEATRQAALQLGRESGHSEVEAWAHEMRCWFALTQGRYREVIEAARAGQAVTRTHSVAVQLAAQEAKAWARMGDRRQVELSLERGRVLLESLPYPEHPGHHFVVDPDKFDFYAMDCYRRAGEDDLAEVHAQEIITKSTRPDGTEHSPMRAAEARITLGVVAARRGDLEAALAAGESALSGDRKSLPSLLMVGRELGAELSRRYSHERPALEYLNRLTGLTRQAS